MKLIKEVCIVIDAFSTGKRIAPALYGKGYSCIHIQSNNNLPKDIVSGLRLSDFIINIVYDGNLEKLIKKLEVYEVKFCIPGSESGVELADELSNTLNLYCNGLALSKARRNKFLMAKAVSNNNLKIVKDNVANNIDVAIRWFRTLNPEDLPAVIKPIDSASGDNVFFCKKEDEVVKAFYSVIESDNFFGAKNEVVYMQSFNRGCEYIVNTVSFEGAHFVTEVWRVRKLNETAIYEYCEIIDAKEREFHQLTEYTKNVLDALGIKFGAGSTELKYTEKNGPVLIESAARLMGAAELSFTQEVFGYDQVSILLEAYLTPEVFKERAMKQSYEMKRAGIAVLLISDSYGIVQRDFSIKKHFTDVKNIFTGDIQMEAGMKLEKTVDMLTSPGTIYLLSEDKDKLWQSYAVIRNIEKNGLYKNLLNNRLEDICFKRTIFYQEAKKYIEKQDIEDYSFDNNSEDEQLNNTTFCN